MKPWQFAVAALVLLATSGCRTDPAIPILERELRMKEDEIYRLRGTVEDLQDTVNSSERRAAGKSRDDSDRNTQPRGNSSASGSGGEAPSSNFAPPKVDLSTPSSSEVPKTLRIDGNPPPVAVPEVPESLRGPSPSSKMDRRPRSGNGPGGSSDATLSDGPALGGFSPGGAGAVKTISRETPGRLVADGGQSMAGSANGDSRCVKTIVIDRMLTGGINDGDLAGDKGVLVVVEPRDGKGRGVDAPAAMSVVVVDPALTGNSARVARWDFTAAETAAMFRRTNAGAAIHIDATWSEGRPTHGKLHVFVRYTTADGRKLEADQPIEIALAGEKGLPHTAPDPSAPPETSMGEDAARSAESVAERPRWSPERR
jgi:hypothetical protein